MFFLHVRMWLLVGVLFAIVYSIVVMVGYSMGVGNFYTYLIFALVMMFIQYMIGPNIVEWSMRVKYVKHEDYPRLYQMVESLAMRAQMPMPRIAVAQLELPNAFAFGRGIRDGRVCVTEGLMRLLSDEELKAVLGHELTHLKNRDVLTITLLSVIPTVLYHFAWSTMYSRRRDGGNAALVGMAAFLFYFITNLLVLYASRIREYFADQGSILLGNQPAVMASSLYKLVYGSARTNREAVREVEGLKAFFVNDPSQARKEIRELAQLDLDKSGTIEASELDRLRNAQVKLGFGDQLMELLSTHPNMLKRIKHLSSYRTI